MAALPLFPSTRIRQDLSPTQLATLNATISSSLLEALALPPTRRDTPAARAFIASYAKDSALGILQSLVWETEFKSDKAIKKRVLTLAEKLAASSESIDAQTLLDLTITFGTTHPTRTRALFASAVSSNPSLQNVFTTQVVPAFIALMQPAHSSGLYGLRKTAHCISSLLHVSPPEIARVFSRKKEFVSALGQVYDEGLAAVARSYGGINVLVQAQTTGRELDEWERLWMQTKVAFMDSFHVLVEQMLEDVSSASGHALGVESEKTFDVVFALLEIQPSSSSSEITSTPFLNRSLIADYQGAYDLSKTLATALRHAKEKDARLDLLEASLSSLGEGPGALKLLLRSSGMPMGIDYKGKGKGRAQGPAPSAAASFATPKEDPDLDLKVSQVLDVFSDQEPSYIRALLARSGYGTAEKVIEAFLEGTAPTDLSEPTQNSWVEEARHPQERRNVFDEVAVDVSQVHIGKRTDEGLRDRSAIEQMKADTLRRAEAMSDEEDDEEEGALHDNTAYYAVHGKGKGKGISLAFDDEDDTGGIKVRDGSGSDSEGDEEDEEERAAPHVSPETICELAYLRDPKLFDRDVQTKRSKPRADLKAQTGWTDDQLEGWRIMLERNPRKDKILQKHEFAGNLNQPLAMPGPSNRGGAGGGRGRGGPGGGDSGRGGGANRGKNKASRGNHNRKRGHDKKMARGGGGMPVG